jgi:hypothetical protein
MIPAVSGTSFHPSLPHFSQGFQAIHARHHDIQQTEIHRIVSQHPQRCLSVFRRIDMKLFFKIRDKDPS